MVAFTKESVLEVRQRGGITPESGSKPSRYRRFTTPATDTNLLNKNLSPSLQVSIPRWKVSSGTKSPSLPLDRFSYAGDQLFDLDGSQEICCKKLPMDELHSPRTAFFEDAVEPVRPPLSQLTEFQLPLSGRLQQFHSEQNDVAVKHMVAVSAETAGARELSLSHEVDFAEFQAADSWEDYDQHQANCTLRPCRYAFKRGGCKNGYACEFCHLCGGSACETEKVPRKGQRPCKGKRERYRKLVDKLGRMVESNPSLDIEALPLPPSISANDTIRTKLICRLQSLQANKPGCLGDADEYFADGCLLDAMYV